MASIRTFEFTTYGYCTQEDARSVACPKCKAEADQKCVGLRGQREQCHQERHWARQRQANERPLQRRRGTTREEAIVVDCPYCGVVAGKLCVGRRGERKRAHRQRHEARIERLG
ncbi:zinc finger domain-containing protein [Alloyangia pacifica]|uniref:zinc finger domain-containing protein n=1 Tax=Alloyangia pacifica TaxID=311180 RepID=UPI003D2EA010